MRGLATINLCSYRLRNEWKHFDYISYTVSYCSILFKSESKFRVSGLILEVYIPTSLTFYLRFLSLLTSSWLLLLNYSIEVGVLCTVKIWVELYGVMCSYRHFHIKSGSFKMRTPVILSMIWFGILGKIYGCGSLHELSVEYFV
jgi:hypothetical protein